VIATFLVSNNSMMMKKRIESREYTGCRFSTSNSQLFSREFYFLVGGIEEVVFHEVIRTIGDDFDPFVKIEKPFHLYGKKSFGKEGINIRTCSHGDGFLALLL
jgi:hypothetical protein